MSSFQLIKNTLKPASYFNSQNSIIHTVRFFLENKWETYLTGQIWPHTSFRFCTLVSPLMNDLQCPRTPIQVFTCLISACTNYALCNWRAFAQGILFQGQSTWNASNVSDLHIWGGICLCGVIILFFCSDIYTLMIPRTTEYQLT